MENPAADQLPEAHSLPDGFVDSPAEPMAPLTPTIEQEMPLTDYKEEKLLEPSTDYKEEKLLEPDFRPELVVNELRSSEVKPEKSEKNEEDKNLIEILEENVPIDMAKYFGYVQAPQCGAIATFSGTTRDTFDGKSVLELRYEAYLPMAIRCLKSICSSARSAWNLDSIAVAHRLGPVPVGETSVFIAVSSVHRADALNACNFLINEIKASVPIWKKEVYANGEVWKENSEFLERRLELGKNDLPGRVWVSGRRKEEKGCCAMKVKVDTGTTDSCTK